MRESFIFYASFYEALKELPNELRLEIFDAVCEFSLNGKEPELTGVARAIFALIRPQIAANFARYENGCKGGRPKTETKPNENQNQTETKPNENQVGTNSKPNDNVNENVNVKENPPLSPLTRGEGDEKNAKIEFFEKYPALNVKRCKDDGIDYTVLIREFEQSAMLRGMYSFSKVVSMYTAIERGDFRDKPKASANPAVDAANARSAREKWYADRQAQAEAAAYGYQKKAKGNSRFCEIEREIARMNLEIAKAEVAGSNSLLSLREYQERLQEERVRILKKLGIEEWQLLPRYSCEKCNDSGYMQDGRACDCYKP